MNYITKFEIRKSHTYDHTVTFKASSTKWFNVTIPYMEREFVYLQIELEDQKPTDLLGHMCKEVKVGLQKGALSKNDFERIENDLIHSQLEIKGVAVSMDGYGTLIGTNFIMFKVIDYDPVDVIITIMPLLHIVN